MTTASIDNTDATSRADPEKARISGLKKPLQSLRADVDKKMGLSLEVFGFLFKVKKSLDL